MEEFEFKPLTEGLGFHNNKAKAKTAFEPSQEATIDKVAWTSTSLEKKGVDITEEGFASPLPRPEFKSAKKATDDKDFNKTAPTLDELIKNLEKNRLPSEKLDKKTAKTVQKEMNPEFFATSTISAGAGFLDGMLVMALTLLGFIALLTITNADLVKIWSTLHSPMLAAASISVLLLMGTIYYLTTRIFIGFTPGEWAYEQQLGLPSEQTTASYQARIILRTLINVATGFILFPVIGFIVGRDILGGITGARVYQRR